MSDGRGNTGIWVSSVASGSPADRAGIKPADILLEPERQVLATDGTMRDYCDVLRPRQPTAVMEIRVLRFQTGQLLTGQINGRPLA
ncbi:MAG: hypothetical protein FJ029_04240 [Actinobacteria bacterium]|nr:hypothetical protein [Actinomycetota bacterium]